MINLSAPTKRDYYKPMQCCQLKGLIFLLLTNGPSCHKRAVSCYSCIICKFTAKVMRLSYFCVMYNLRIIPAVITMKIIPPPYLLKILSDGAYPLVGLRALSRRAQINCRGWLHPRCFLQTITLIFLYTCTARTIKH